MLKFIAAMVESHVQTDKECARLDTLCYQKDKEIFNLRARLASVSKDVVDLDFTFRAPQMPVVERVHGQASYEDVPHCAVQKYRFIPVDYWMSVKVKVPYCKRDLLDQLDYKLLAESMGNTAKQVQKEILSGKWESC